MFEIGDKVLYPMYGAGVIDGIVERKILGAKKKYFTLSIPFDDKSELIPVDTCETIGVRPIISAEEAQNVLTEFREKEISEDENWNKRHRENIEKMHTGDIHKLIGVVKGLMLRDMTKGLSTSERKMYIVAKQVFISEIVLTGMASRSDVENILFDIVAALK